VYGRHSQQNKHAYLLQFRLPALRMLTELPEVEGTRGSIALAQ
jgi:hypothetical protein